MTQSAYAKVLHVFLALMSVIICFAPKIPAAIISLSVITLLVVIIIGFFKKYLTPKSYVLFWLLISFYFIYLIGILFSLDQSLGLKYAEYKLFFLLMPLAFSFRPKFVISLKLPAIILAISCIFLAAIGVVNAFKCYETYPWVRQCFTSSNISPIQHPTYYSVYLLFSIFILWHVFKENTVKWIRVLLICYSIFAMIMYILCFSMAGFLLIALVGSVLGFLWLKRKLNSLAAIMITAAISIALFFAANSTEGFSNELNATAKSVQSYINNRDDYFQKVQKQEEINGDETRIIVWLVTFELIAENPFGAGTGSLDIIIANRLKKHGLTDFAEENLNSHNQYLQTTLEIGFLGLLVLLLIFYFGIRDAIRLRFLPMLILVFAFLLHCNFESMFQRQSGIFFFLFWVCLLTVYSSQAHSASQFRKPEKS